MDPSFDHSLHLLLFSEPEFCFLFDFSLSMKIIVHLLASSKERICHNHDCEAHTYIHSHTYTNTLTQTHSHTHGSHILEDSCRGV